MGCADVCLSDYDYDGNEFYHEKIVTARKEHRCTECGVTIALGERYERASGKNDGGIFTETTCLLCREIRRAFTCGSWLFGELWNSIESEMFPVWRRLGPWDCLAKLESNAAVDECVRRFHEWQEEG